MPEPGVPSDNTTLVAVLGRFQESGYDADFFVEDDGRLRCRTCGTTVAAEAAELDQLRRVEGASDPADMAAVLGIRCRACGARGTAVLRFGPEASAGEAQVLREIDDQRP